MKLNEISDNSGATKMRSGLGAALVLGPVKHQEVVIKAKGAVWRVNQWF